MDERRKESLKKASDKICSNLKREHVRKICNYLHGADVLTQEQVTAITNITVQSEQNEVLYDIVCSGSNLVYDKFRKAIVSNQIKAKLKSEIIALLPNHAIEVAKYELPAQGKTGLALVVNNVKFKNFKIEERKGSEKDNENVKRMLKKLNFDIYKDGKTNNLTKIDMEREIENFAKLSAHKKYSCSVVIVMTHGTEGILLAADSETNEPVTIKKEETARRESRVADQEDKKEETARRESTVADQEDKKEETARRESTDADQEEEIYNGNSKKVTFSNFVSVNWIMEQFIAKNAPNLKGKPKLFFFQACRGEDKMVADFAVEHSTTILPVSHETKKIANHCDFLIAYSTVANYVSWRDKIDGSWFIQTVVQVFETLSEHHDVLSMLTEVIREIQELSTGDVNGYKMVPEIRSTLTKKLYFRPYFSQHKK